MNFALFICLKFTKKFFGIGSLGQSNNASKKIYVVFCLEPVFMYIFLKANWLKLTNLTQLSIIFNVYEQHVYLLLKVDVLESVSSDHSVILASGKNFLKNIIHEQNKNSLSKLLSSNLKYKKVYLLKMEVSVKRMIVKVNKTNIHRKKVANVLKLVVWNALEMPEMLVQNTLSEKLLQKIHK